MGTPVSAFVGSANYSQSAFLGRTREFMVNYDDAQRCYDYYQGLIDQTIYCEHQDADAQIVIYDDKYFEYKSRLGRLTPDIVASDSGETPASRRLPSVTISLLDDNGDVPTRSGLNCGQRCWQGREPGIHPGANRHST